jgi:SAM-dependent methyltransferase
MIDANEYLRASIPNDHSRQTDAAALVTSFAKAESKPKQVVDLGCGDGRSVDLFAQIMPGAAWLGIDIEESKEVRRRTRKDVKFITFDGVNIPLETGSQELIYSCQVFEHVRYPEQLLRDVGRCLAPHGVLIGQTSHLEPYHSHSIWNFTPYGFKRICEDAGLELTEIRPGIDALTLCERSFSGARSAYNRWFSEESPKNVIIEERGKLDGMSPRSINARKLLACGQFSFICRPF